jgi:hypothetical protein
MVLSTNKRGIIMQRAAKGTKATFYLPNGNKIFGVIEYMPAATGDSWIVSEFFEGKILGTIYIQQFSYMRLHKD